jgi:hypothetical protein
MSYQLPATSYQHVPLPEAGGRGGASATTQGGRHSPVACRLSPDPRDTVRFPWIG